MTEIKPTNFIEQAIVDDITGKGLKKIITRFPPEPNGYLHIGHAKAICIDFATAKKFGGRTNLRFDDTNPSKENVEYAESIKRDILWLGYKWHKLYYASGYYDLLYACAVDLIKQGLAYVCELSAEEISQTRGTLTSAGKDSPYRSRSVEENLDLFTRMRAGEYANGAKVLRAKIDMASPNINMRDPVIYRISRESHFRTKNKWCIYPMYDFAHPLEDAIEGITHSLCTLEFEDHRPLYNWFVDTCRIIPHKPRQIEFARLNIDGTVMSKRFLLALVNQGVVDGWDDPRMPTLCGLRRRGYPASAIREFCSRIGVSKSNSLVQPHILEACVREQLNATATRVMAVMDPLKVLITNYGDKTEKIYISNNPTNAKSGKHAVIFARELYIEREDFNLNPTPKFHRLTEGGIVRLMGGKVLRCDKAIVQGGEVLSLECSIVSDPTAKPKGTIHWVSARGGVPMVSRNIGSLMIAGKAFDDANLANNISPKSMVSYDGYIETFASKLRSGTELQFIRMGYYYGDKTSSKNNLVYNQVVSLKDSK